MTCRHGLYILITVLVGASAVAEPSSDATQSIDQAILKTHAEIDETTRALNDLRSKVDRERTPLAKEVQQTRENLRQKRGESERTHRLLRQSEQDQRTLAAEVAQLEEDLRFASGMIQEYRRAMETRAHRAEHAWIQTKLADVTLYTTDIASPDNLVRAAADLLDLAETRNRMKVGGMHLEGAALDAQGLEHQGRFAVLGPLAYFSTADKSTAGLSQTRMGSLLPSIYTDLPQDDVFECASLVMQGRAKAVPLDVTGGDALKVAQAQATLWEQFEKGGFIMWPLAAAAVVALTLILAKLLDLACMQVNAPKAINELLTALNASDLAEADRIAARVRPPLRMVLKTAVQHPHLRREHLEEILHEHIIACMPRMERFLGALAVLGGVAPLLGLLGTVTGMIHTFELVTIFGTGDARMLSGGISEALLTTQFGLAIAIPVLIVHALLARRVRVAVAALEDAAAWLTSERTARKAATVGEPSP